MIDVFLLTWCSRHYPSGFHIDRVLLLLHLLRRYYLQLSQSLQKSNLVWPHRLPILHRHRRLLRRSPSSVILITELSATDKSILRCKPQRKFNNDKSLSFACQCLDRCIAYVEVNSHIVANVIAQIVASYSRKVVCTWFFK